MKKFRSYLLEKAVPKIMANRGDVAEVLVGAAVTAKFYAKPVEKVTRKDVEDILQKVIATGNMSVTRPDIASGTTQVSDGIRFKVGVPAKAWEFIKNSRNWPDVNDLFDSAIKYVNSDRRLGLQTRVMYRNSKKNDIFINSDGTGDQKGTKADIKLEIDGKPTRNQISLKVKGGEQFAQVAGVGFEKIITIWKKLGIDVSSAKDAYNKHFIKADLETRFKDRASINQTAVGENLRAAAGEAYKVGADKMKTAFTNADSDMIHSLAMFIKSGAVKEEDNIELVKLTGGTFQRAKFGKKFEENMKAVASSLTVEYSRKTDPIVKIYDKSIGSGAKGLLIQIRGKYTAESSGSGDKKVYKAYFRNIVEAGDLFFELATDR